MQKGCKHSRKKIVGENRSFLETVASPLKDNDGTSDLTAQLLSFIAWICVRKAKFLLYKNWAIDRKQWYGERILTKFFQHKSTSATI